MVSSLIFLSLIFFVTVNPISEEPDLDRVIIKNASFTEDSQLFDMNFCGFPILSMMG